jgi:hypothetical protein
MRTTEKLTFPFTRRAGALALLGGTLLAGALVPACGSDDAPADDPDSVVGRWQSPICEARPDGMGGYRYVERDFRIRDDGTWEGTIGFFADEGCETPVSTAVIGGGYEIGAPSSKVYGASEARFDLDVFRFTPRADFFVDFLNTAPAGTCGTETWQLGVTQDISETGCALIGVDHESCPSEHELVYVLGGQLMFGGRPGDGGNLCTEARRPITLQTPLLREGAAIEAAPVTAAVGRWESPICETRPDGRGGFLYLTRDITAHADGTWEGRFDFYAEDTCVTPVSSVALGGGYSMGVPSARVYGATEAEFAIDVTRITPRAEFFADLLNGAEPGTCGSETWAVGQTQDVSATGCAVLGIDHASCPSEHELVLILDDRLHFGGRPEDGGNLCTAERRPITLQTPLLRAE